MHALKESFFQNNNQINDDIESINAAKQNMHKFSLLYDKYYIPVYRFVYNRVENMDVATDLCSQTFLKAMSGLAHYKIIGLPFSSWLFKIARNEINQHYRAQKKERNFYMNFSKGEELISDFYSEEPLNPELCLKPLLESLSVSEVELIEMRYFEKISFKEIAVITDISEENAKVKVHRILKKLKEKALHFRSVEIGFLYLLINLSCFLS
jgi:RNA polymerase sigma-70 factor, ECF subfamily